MPYYFLPFRRRAPRAAPEPQAAGSNDPGVDFPRAHRFNEQLQRGSQGYVERWTHVRTNTVIVAKIIARPLHPPPEIEILRNLPPHRSIVQYLGHYEGQPAPEKVSILFEYCEGGDLFSLRCLSLARDKHTFSEGFMWSVYQQLTEALAFLHDGVDAQHPLGRTNWRAIVHRDLKFENVLVKTMGHNDDWSDIKLKLGDFGMAGFYDAANSNPSGYIGTTYFWPPEVTWETKRLSPASDVWGVAAMIHELAHNFGPVVDPTLVEQEWLAQGRPLPYPEDWCEIYTTNYWASKAPRRVVPINLDPGVPVPSLSDPRLGGRDEPALAFRRNRPSAKYSDALNECMMAGLAMSPDDRFEAPELMRLVREGHLEFVFQRRSIAMEQMERR